jgi:hypothetical protein
VYDYVAGRKSWGSYGLPREGTNVAERTAGDMAHRDVRTCMLDERLAAVRERVRTAGWDTCVVVNEQRLLPGLVVEGNGLERRHLRPHIRSVSASIHIDTRTDRN